ncbi:MAG: hypothetical protein HC898_00630 [Phycisphaerales bacterium]|nr:hypothetical protein [Phycisphaerales bacterium]
MPPTSDDVYQWLAGSADAAIRITQAHEHLRSAWQAWNRPGQLGSLVFDTPHEFNRQMQQHAWDWLSRWL